MEREVRRAVGRVAGIGPARPARVGHHAGELRLDLGGRVGQVDGVPVALAHLPPVGPDDLGTLGEQGLGLGEDRTVGLVEAARDLPRELDVGRLVDADRDLRRLVHEDVGRLEDRVAEEAVGREVPVGELLALLLVGRIALEPGDGRQHAEQEIELGMLLDGRLLEERRAPRIEPDREPVEHHLDGVLFDLPWRGIVGGERMPVGDEEEAGGFALETDPVLERAVVVAEVLASGRAGSTHDHALHRLPPASYQTKRSKKAISGSTSRVTTVELSSTRRTRAYPMPSKTRSARAWPGGRSAVSTRPPSRRGMGRRLKTARRQLIESDAAAISRSPMARLAGAFAAGSQASARALTAART